MIGIVFAIFGTIALGFFARAANILPKSAYAPLNDFVYYVSMPLLIFAKLAETKLQESDIIFAAANAFPILLFMAAAAAFWKLKVFKPKACALFLLCSTFGNIVYMGFPALQLRFGESAVAYGAIISLVANIIMFTLGFALLGMMSKKEWRGLAAEKILKNTVIPACILGAAFSLAGIALPKEIMGIFSSIGSTTAPLALFSMGMFLHGKNMGKDNFSAILLSFSKLALFPLAFILSGLFFSLQKEQFGISLLESMMPIAVTNFIIAQKFGLDSQAVAQAILASTILSIPALFFFDIAFAML
jgi:predicted permease